MAKVMSKSELISKLADEHSDKLTRKDVNAGCKSKFMMEFPDCVRFCEEKVAAYNARPHSSLPKIFDEQLGR